MDRWLYLIIDLGAISIPLLASFHKRLRFDRQFVNLLPALLLTMLVFIPWDMAKTHFRIWGFNPRYITGFYIGNLPVEEWLFFLVIPYACIFTYHALNVLISKEVIGKSAFLVSEFLAATLILTGLIYITHIYTSVTFIFTGIFLLIHSLYLKKDYLGRFFLMYLVTLIPFFIVDGLLTGSWIPEEVVFYSQQHIIGIRLGTIPVEDMIYGMLMLLMNLTWFEYFRLKKSKAQTA